MDIAYFPNSVARNGGAVMTAMIQALRSRGHAMVADSMSADAAVIWSLLWAGRMRANREVFEHYRSQHKPVIVLEVGCLRRGDLWRVTVLGDHRTQPSVARSSVLGVSLEPWRDRRGSDILVCLQHSKSQQWQGRPDPETWLEHTVTQIRQHTDRPIVVRPHPRQRITTVPLGCQIMQPQPVAGTYDSFDFEQALTRAWAVVNVNSHPGSQSIISGVPAFVDPGSAAAPVANLDFGSLEDPGMPDRDTWFEDLCWSEFSVAEIQRGLPLDHLVLSQPAM